MHLRCVYKMHPNYSKMLEYVKQILAVLPRSHVNVIIFGTLTGPRLVEACNSVRLIHTDLSNFLILTSYHGTFPMEEHLSLEEQKSIYQCHDRPTLANSQDRLSSIIHIHLRLLTLEAVGVLGCMVG